MRESKSAADEHKSPVHSDRLMEESGGIERLESDCCRVAQADRRGTTSDSAEPYPAQSGTQHGVRGRAVDEKMLEDFLHRSRDRSPESTGTLRDTSGTADSNAAASHNREDARLSGSMTKDEDQQDDDD